MGHTSSPLSLKENKAKLDERGKLLEKNSPGMRGGSRGISEIF